jgi:hypothetical protein
MNVLLAKALYLSKRAVSLGIQYYVVTTVVEDLTKRVKKTIETVRKQKEIEA